MDVVDLITEPRRTLAILVGVVAPVAAIFAWLDQEPSWAAVATVLLLGATAAAVPAARNPDWRPALPWLALAIALGAAGIYVGFVVGPSA